ncbi:hypothetical protein SDC9_103530 [bioreactor metagenome]|uniref:Uncharacterized protein n=1 Tax=bioreactor metagenome TaxID=1076179 RepID=A0A645AV38_9ZZZZ
MIDVFKEIVTRRVIANRAVLQEEAGGKRKLGFVDVASGTEQECVRRELFNTLTANPVERLRIVQPSSAVVARKIDLLHAKAVRRAFGKLARELRRAVRGGLVRRMGNDYLG